MESLFRYLAPPSSCGYLPDRQWSLEYEMVGAMDAGEYKDVSKRIDRLTKVQAGG